jgi:hypothetical protein
MLFYLITLKYYSITHFLFDMGHFNGFPHNTIVSRICVCVCVCVCEWVLRLFSVKGYLRMNKIQVKI